MGSVHAGATYSVEGAKVGCIKPLFSHTHGMLENWGPGYHFFSDNSIGNFEAFLALEHAQNPSQPPISALHLDFPSNLLLRPPDVSRLRKLADQYGFLIIIDETVGNFLIIQLLSYADIVTCSLTKAFSELANVMSGAFLLNPASKHYCTFKTYLDTNYEYTYFSEDSICMEANSRDMKRRVQMIDHNTEAIADLCYDDSLKGGTVIHRVLYPKYYMREHFERCWWTIPLTHDMEVSLRWSSHLRLPPQRLRCIDMLQGHFIRHGVHARCANLLKQGFIINWNERKRME
ncbi:pyridoxal phosphate-dependent transferase [Desarmillaria ectypa]|nr:pyridoxal phosphate-dependent transferase [Desarmillaria ectypa]